MTRTALLSIILAISGVVAMALVIHTAGQRETALLEDRIVALEARLDAMSTRNLMDAARPGRPRMVAPPPAVSVPVPMPLDPGETTALDGHARPAVAADDGNRSDEALAQTIDRHVEAAVDERVAEIETRRTNKDPSFDVFAEVLELEEDQIKPVQDEIWLGQQESRQILDIPTADGGNLVDELVDVMAYSEAERPEAGPMFMKWLGRVMSEQIPGSNTTYGASIDVVNKKMYRGLQRELTEEQYEELVSWRLDLNRIDEIENSPWGDFEERVAERLAELGAGESGVTGQGSEGN